MRKLTLDFENHMIFILYDHIIMNYAKLKLEFLYKKPFFEAPVAKPYVKQS